FRLVEAGPCAREVLGLEALAEAAVERRDEGAPVLPLAAALEETREARRGAELEGPRALGARHRERAAEADLRAVDVRRGGQTARRGGGGGAPARGGGAPGGGRGGLG